MNSRLYSDFDNATNLLTKEICREKLFDYLWHGSIVERQVSLIKLDTLLNKEETRIYISNLTGCDGKIREVAAFKFFEFSSNPNIAPFLADYPRIIAEATVDIDSNVCRYIIDSLFNFKTFKKFCEIYTNSIIEMIYTAFNQIETLSFKDKKYKYNKQYFKLYWCLEALCIFCEFIDKDTLSKIIEKTADCSEYTVREKAAKLFKISAIHLNLIKNRLKNDENYYVKNVLNV